MQGTTDRKLNRKRLRLIALILSAVAVVVLIGLGTYSFGRYMGASSQESGASVASLIVELDGGEDLGDVVRGETLTAYFDIRNYRGDDVTSVAYDCYIYVIDRDGAIISGAEVCTSAGYQTNNKITQNNPNYFKALEQVASGDHEGAFLLEYVPPQKTTYNLRLKIDGIEAAAVSIKLVAVQKGSAG